MWGKRHCYRRRVDTPKLDSVERRRAARYDGILEAELTQCGPAPWHQPFAARLVARKILLVDNDYAKAASRRKERRRGSGWPCPKHRDIGVEGFRQAVTLDRRRCELRLELGLIRFGDGLARDGHLCRRLTLGATWQS